MSGLAGQRSWMGDAAATPSGDARDDGAAAAAASSTNASAISFGFAATAILIAMFLLMAIFEHLIKPGWAASRGSHADSDADGDAQPSHSGRHQRDRGSPEKLAPPPKMEVVVAAADLTVVMPGQRYPTFLAQPAPLLFPCPREGVRWPPHDDNRRSFLPP
ncbi:uncharacterized protein LOC123443147 [Hordeum vulgare subsp. vulgare]|uniref:Predicted protein n=1 Tax=Hordeum vulgare subsp. vulgare TaxID=112509 RepID=F2EK79_HORVV|nr:uncharacterized protein LOC123443147 [Hordeum vulgare subsp. vulgare]XP_044975374.1 uncharacterized protein LOC123443147 [Hordeum vulgare subsp. vulgare]XP_044975380.1 uncharacterized protein LOC123443147 [Hordeum vulgare subsp. vulgare]XP_044975387.1 uncharacterized protein LOC123443147 [Hordeum vulgare subsp. vulgare]XP_044975394.1 uncharacterized protein LOC123443147 [Hordeum vulgare subsp. vulgare]XP_044975402.1 uncharacterized protein LOC123443147 [Hordeum vulgare subsp. vulgare]XP_04